MNECPKPKTHRDPKYLLWLREQDCVFCGCGKNDYLSIVPTHQGGGMSIKGPDDEALPLCADCHLIEHQGQKTFWKKVKIKTGMTREQLVDEHWKMYKEE